MGLTAAGDGGTEPGRGPRFPARFGGSCTRCGDDIEEGEDAGFPKGLTGIMHAECADETEDEE